MFTITYKMQMPSGILIFEVDLMIERLEDGAGYSAPLIKEALTQWWDDPESPRRTPEEACLGAWATITDHLVAKRQHPRVQCSRVSVDTSGQTITFKPTEDVWSDVNV